MGKRLIGPMIKTSWYTHPVFVFIFSLIALLGSLTLYIIFYLEANAAFEAFIAKHNLDGSALLQTKTWVVILTLSLLVAIILIGLLLIFIYYSKVIQLYRQQQNFINGFTHELKTPIASLSLFLDAMTMHKLSREDELHYMKLMKKDVARLQDNVEQILNLARIEDKSYRSQFILNDIGHFIEQVVEKAHHLFPEAQLIYHRDTQGHWMISMDASSIEMLLMNLLSNAVQHNHHEQKKVEVFTKLVGKWIEIHVCDNGVGLDKSEQKKIFKKFYQVGATTKGSGLGLYIVSQIAKLHRGSVRVESEGRGHGSQMIVRLPFHKDFSESEQS